MHPFTCCTRQDNSKYLHGPCGCPSATFNCESEQIDATICGWHPVNQTTPPSAYRKLTIDTGTATIEGKSLCTDLSQTPPVIDQEYTEWTLTYISGPIVYTLEGCPYSSDDASVDFGNYYWSSEWTKPQWPDPPDGSSKCDNIVLLDFEEATEWYTNFDDFTNWHSNADSVAPDDLSCTVDGESLGSNLDYQFSPDIIKTISEIDTEDDAIARETPTEGTSCSSIWETRSTGFTFTKRTSEYTIECADLVVGYEYEVIPSIRRRTVVIGSYGVWEDVTLAPETFTATATTETFAAVTLNHIQGYEYEITGVNIEKKA